MGGVAIRWVVIDKQQTPHLPPPTNPILTYQETTGAQWVNAKQSHFMHLYIRKPLALRGLRWSISMVHLITACVTMRAKKSEKW